MGLGLHTDISYGLVGVGYAVNEAIVGQTLSFSSVYPNLPVQMVNENLINTVAFSLWLNDLGRFPPPHKLPWSPLTSFLDSNSGNILFGGIDTEKYKGDLTRIDILPTVRDLFTAFMVSMTSLTAVSPSGSDTLTSKEFPIPVVLDSGTTLSYLPTDLATQIWKEVGAVYSSELEVAVLPCNMQNSAGYFSFGFAGPNGPRINVTMDELVLDLTSGRPPIFTSGQYRGQDVCSFGIQNFTEAPYLLGDTFLRSAYVVYDLVNNQIGIAATDFNSTDSKVVAFPSSGAPIPSATVAPGQSEATAAPSVTSPAYAASQGFTDSAKSGGTTKNAAGGGPRAGGLGMAVVVAVSMGLVGLGSGVFWVL